MPAGPTVYRSGGTRGRRPGSVTVRVGRRRARRPRRGGRLPDDDPHAPAVRRAVLQPLGRSGRRSLDGVEPHLAVDRAAPGQDRRGQRRAAGWPRRGAAVADQTELPQGRDTTLPPVVGQPDPHLELLAARRPGVLSRRGRALGVGDERAADAGHGERPEAGPHGVTDGCRLPSSRPEVGTQHQDDRQADPEQPDECSGDDEPPQTGPSWPRDGLAATSATSTAATFPATSAATCVTTSAPRGLRTADGDHGSGFRWGCTESWTRMSPQAPPLSMEKKLRSLYR